MNTTFCDFNYEGINSLEDAKQSLMSANGKETWAALRGLYCAVRFNMYAVYSMGVMECGLERDPGGTE